MILEKQELLAEVDEKVADTVVSFINDILGQVSAISDFSLVDISHEDEVWKNTYKNFPGGNGTMRADDIISEYCSKA